MSPPKRLAAEPWPADDRSPYWTTSTNGAATSALRPRDGNYASPSRETVPVGFGQKTPINFNVSASWRM